MGTTITPARGITARPKPDVRLRIPRGPLFVGSYHKIPVALSNKVKWDDLEFVIPEGPKGGLISPSKDVLSTRNVPTSCCWPGTSQASMN